MSVNAGTHTRSIPLGATKPLAIAMAFTAWFKAPAPIACISALPFSLSTPAKAPATELGLDFDAVLSRLVNEKLVQKFALKFLDDPSFQNLKDALDSKDVETAFRAAHTLKGVCLNLGFDNLYPSSKDLTELLRAGSMDGYEDLFAEVEKEYNRTCEALRKVS